MKYSLEEIAGIIKGEILSNHGDQWIEHLLLDSRKLNFPLTSLFIALTGSRRNGHLFIREVYDKGIFNFVITENIAIKDYPSGNFIMVKDAMQALHALAIHHRKKFKIPVIGITGSNGKTIVKEWLNQLLEGTYNIVRSPKSYNSQIGVPLSVWQMNESNQLGIFEAGISESGEMDKLEKIIQPSLGVFTNIGEAHSEGFLNVRQKVNEKLQLFKNVDTLIYCKDYPSINEGIASYIRQLREGTTASKINYFGWSAKTDAMLRVTSIVKNTDSTTISAVYMEQPISIRILLTDDASIENAITCWAVLCHLGIKQEYAEQRFLQLSHIAMRLELKKGINNCSIINDSYSADLSSLKIALDYLSHQHQHGRRTVILSDILQSGKTEKDLYMEVADLLKGRNINRLIGIGKQISRHHQVFETVPGMQLNFYPDVDSFLGHFYQLSFSHETILLKGARVFAFEHVGRLLEQKVHQTVLEISQSALLHNLRVYQNLLRPATKLMAMVKAFSYGSGSYEIANMLQFHKVDYLAVAYADEGIDLRKAGITLPVMVMNPEESTFDALVLFNLEPDIYSLNLLKDFDTFLKKKGVTHFPVHIELETGMNRLGFARQEIPGLIRLLLASSFDVKSVFSHLVSSEDPMHDEFTQHQAKSFLLACTEIQTATGYSFIRHIANSSAVSRHPDLQLDMVRLGIGLYGINNAANSSLDLKDVSSLKTTIAQIKKINKGETVGYGRKGVANEDSLVATVRIGYADGYPRRLGNGKGKMLVKGQYAPVIGNVCMDMTMINITGIEGVQEGDDVIVFGARLPVQQLAEWAETIPYEILTGISQRVKRVYFEES